MGGGTGNAGGSNETESEREDSILRLNEDMRLAWLNHVYWTRMYLMSAVADNADQQAVEERLLETADEITDVFARYLPIATTRQLRNLLTEHIEIAGQIIQALKAKNMSDYDALVKEWYRNANQMAALFANYNPYFESRETRNMLLNHLDLTREEIEEAYEKNTGVLIAEYFKDKDYVAMPAVLCKNHGPFTWGKNAHEAVHNAVVLENVAMMACRCEMVNPQVQPAPQELQDKHYLRKHGPNAYYGQK